MIPLKYAASSSDANICYENLFGIAAQSISIEVYSNVKAMEKLLIPLGFRKFRYRKIIGGGRPDSMLYHQKERLLVNISNGMASLRFPLEDSTVDPNLMKKLLALGFKFRIKRNTDAPKIYLLTRSASFNLKEIEIPEFHVSLEENYNDDFIDIHHTIVKGLQDDASSNLVVLRSEPGCGKTYYIRHLIKSIPNRSFVFMPSNISMAITNPEFLAFAINNLMRSILVIEDAELILMKRGNIGNNDSVSTLLNLTDGLMKDALGLKIICTANCQMNEIDDALLRKGRILAKYQFNRLSLEKTNHLLAKRNANPSSEPMTLSEIFNSEQSNFKEKRSTVGFKAYA